MREPSPVLCLAGATASGKSAVVQVLAERLGGAILSADAMLVYRGMDIGTAKPSPEERARVPYGGVDCVTPAEDFSVAAWLAAAERFQQTHADKPLFVTGGTGLYFTALLRGLDPLPAGDPTLRAELEALPLAELQARVQAHGLTLPDMANPRRLVRALEIIHLGGLDQLLRRVTMPPPPILALAPARPLLHTRIAQRVERMYADGLLDETAELRRAYPHWSRTARQAIGYAEAIDVLDGRATESEAKERTVIRTRQLARRQETYLRHQFAVEWIEVAADDTADSLADRLMERCR